MSFPIAILEIVSDNTNQNGLTISEESISFYTEMLKTIGVSEDEQQHVPPRDFIISNTYEAKFGDKSVVKKHPFPINAV